MCVLCARVSVILALAVLVLPSVSLADAGADPSAPPNVLLITVDTLRADHLGAYDYPLPTSPRIDELARSGVRCAAVMATASETAPATASLLTGLYQPGHRVVENRSTLPADVTTLAEHLRARGYATAGFVGNELVGDGFGFAQGFDHFEIFGQDASLHSDAKGAALAEAWLRSAPTAPWHLWVHFMDPHGPYAPDHDWETRDYPDGWFGDDVPVPVGRGNIGLGSIPRYQMIPRESQLSSYVRRYDGEISFTDGQIGRLVDVVRELGMDERTLIVVTADHGEGLTEHAEYLQHGWFVYETTLHVPLIVSWPGTLPAGHVVTASMSGVDLTPTLLELVGHPAPMLEGASVREQFAADASGMDDHVALAVGARVNHPFAVREGRWKLIHTRAAGPPVPASRVMLRSFDVSERYELYDLVADPGETTNRLALDPAEGARLAERARGFRRALQMSGQRW